MKADNQNTNHNRTIRFSEIPISKEYHLKEMEVCLNYKTEPNEPVIDKAVTLDSDVIPHLIQCVNLYNEFMNLARFLTECGNLAESQDEIVCAAQEILDKINAC